MSLHARLLNDPAFGLVLAVDKPTGATSRDVLNHIQHVFTVHRQQARDPQKLRDPQQLDMPIGGFRATPDAERDGQRKRMSKQQLRELIKIGHGGTLDPLATGVLIVALGTATKQLQHFLTSDACHKTYDVIGQFGHATDSYDSEGQQVGDVMEYGHVTDEMLREVLLRKFTGQIQQRPPAFSALRVNGKRMHELAREAQSSGTAMPTTTARTVTVHAATLLSYDALTGRFSARVACGGGTYIRSIVHDLAVEVGTRAHMVGLRRVRQGPFAVRELVENKQENTDDVAGATGVEETNANADIPAFPLDDLTNATHLDAYIDNTAFMNQLQAYLAASQVHIDARKNCDKLEQKQKRQHAKAQAQAHPRSGTLANDGSGVVILPPVAVDPEEAERAAKKVKVESTESVDVKEKSIDNDSVAAVETIELEGTTSR